MESPRDQAIDYTRTQLNNVKNGPATSDHPN